MNIQSSASAEEPFMVRRVTDELYIGLVTFIALIVAIGYFNQQQRRTPKYV